MNSVAVGAEGGLRGESWEERRRRCTRNCVGRTWKKRFKEVPSRESNCSRLKGILKRIQELQNYEYVFYVDHNVQYSQHSDIHEVIFIHSLNSLTTASRASTRPIHTYRFKGYNEWQKRDTDANVAATIHADIKCMIRSGWQCIFSSVFLCRTALLAARSSLLVPREQWTLQVQWISW